MVSIKRDQGFCSRAQFQERSDGTSSQNNSGSHSWFKWKWRVRLFLFRDCHNMPQKDGRPVLFPEHSLLSLPFSSWLPPQWMYFQIHSWVTLPSLGFKCRRPFTVIWLSVFPPSPATLHSWRRCCFLPRNHFPSVHNPVYLPMYSPIIRGILCLSLTVSESSKWLLIFSKNILPSILHQFHGIQQYLFPWS